MGYCLLRGKRLEVDNEQPATLHLPEWNLLITDSLIGEGVVLWSNVNLYGCTIGPDVRIGAFVEIRSGVTVGAKSKIEPFVFIPEGVSIGEGVFVGPNVVFTNDLYPRACEADGSQKTDYEIVPTRIEPFSSIGAGSVIRCGITIGRGAMIGAGSMVTSDVGDKEVWYGEPARLRRRIP
jgi:acetyltransferase-like isoleucine patch superfamily enzyme